LQQGFGSFFVFSQGSCVSYKKDDKTAAPGDQQASQTLAAVGFLAFAGRMEARAKKTKELP
jgi:hypothetical protein